MTEGEDKNSVDRFSNRIADYSRYRPSYPSEALDSIRSIGDFRPGAKVVDLGSGTGIWTRLLLDAGFQVTAVEPNSEMRGAAEEDLGSTFGFRSVNGTSDSTGLASGTADLVSAAQAFHWFDVEETRKECLRVLKPNAWVALLFNDRLVDASPFLVAYEALLQRYATDYNTVNHSKLKRETFELFFGSDSYKALSFPNVQEFDYRGLEGRLLSSSYAPSKGHPDHGPMLSKLRQIFDQNEENGVVNFEYRTLVYMGMLV